MVASGALLLARAGLPALQTDDDATEPSPPSTIPCHSLHAAASQPNAPVGQILAKAPAGALLSRDGTGLTPADVAIACGCTDHLVGLVGAWDAAAVVPFGGPATVGKDASPVSEEQTAGVEVKIDAAVATLEAVFRHRKFAASVTSAVLGRVRALLAEVPERSVPWVARAVLACSSGVGATVSAVVKLANGSKTAPGSLSDRALLTSLLHVACALSAPRFDGKPPSDKDHPAPALLTAGADPNGKDAGEATGATPLCSALSHSASRDEDDDEREARLGTVQTLVRHGSRAAVADALGVAPLGHAMRGAHWAAANFLLNSASLGDLAAADMKHGYTALHFLCAQREPDVAVLTLLVGKMLKLPGEGGQLDPVSAAGLTPAMLAVKSGALDAYHLLVDRGCSVTAVDASGHTPLLLECMYADGDQDSVDAVVAMGADVNAESAAGERPLEVCLERGRYGAALRLLACDGVEVRPRALERLCLTDLVATGGDDNNDDDDDDDDNTGDAAGDAWKRNKFAPDVDADTRAECVRRVVGALLKAGQLPDVAAVSAMALGALDRRLTGVTGVFLDLGIIDPYGWTDPDTGRGIAHALHADTAALKRVIIDSAPGDRPSWIDRCDDVTGAAPIHAAFSAGSAEAVAMLIEGGADPNALRIDGNTVAHLAARITDAQIAENERVNGDGADPCSTVVPPLVESVLRALASSDECDLACPNADYEPPVVVAAADGNWGVVELIMKLSEEQRERAGEHTQPHEAETVSTMLDVLHLTLSRGAPESVVSAVAKTALPSVEWCKENDFSLREGDDGYTVLHHAIGAHRTIGLTLGTAEQPRIDLVEAIVERLTGTVPGDHSPLQLAAEEIAAEISGDEVSATDPERLLHLQRCFVALLRCPGASRDVDRASARGWTPFHSLATAYGSLMMSRTPPDTPAKKPTDATANAGPSAAENAAGAPARTGAKVPKRPTSARAGKGKGKGGKTSAPRAPKRALPMTKPDPLDQSADGAAQSGQQAVGASRVASTASQRVFKQGVDPKVTNVIPQLITAIIECAESLSTESPINGQIPPHALFELGLTSELQKLISVSLSGRPNPRMLKPKLGACVINDDAYGLIVTEIERGGAMSECKGEDWELETGDVITGIGWGDQEPRDFKQSGWSKETLHECVALRTGSMKPLSRVSVRVAGKGDGSFAVGAVGLTMEQLRTVTSRRMVRVNWMRGGFLASLAADASRDAMGVLAQLLSDSPHRAHAVDGRGRDVFHAAVVSGNRDAQRLIVKHCGERYFRRSTSVDAETGETDLHAICKRPEAVDPDALKMRLRVLRPQHVMRSGIDTSSGSTVSNASSSSSSSASSSSSGVDAGGGGADDPAGRSALEAITLNAWSQSHAIVRAQAMVRGAIARARVRLRRSSRHATATFVAHLNGVDPAASQSSAVRIQRLYRTHRAVKAVRDHRKRVAPVDARENARGMTALHVAVLHGRTELALTLLEATTCDPELLDTTPSRSSPLHIAAAADNLPVVQAYAQRGLLGGFDGLGRTALMVAVLCGAPRAVPFISGELRQGGRLGAAIACAREPVHGETAQHMAVRTLDVETVRRVWTAGTQSGIKDAEGRTAVDLVAVVTTDTKLQFRMKSVLNKPQVLLKPKPVKKQGSSKSEGGGENDNTDAGAAAGDGDADADADAEAKQQKQPPPSPATDDDDIDGDDRRQKAIAVPDLDDIPEIGDDSLEISADHTHAADKGKGTVGKGGKENGQQSHGSSDSNANTNTSNTSGRPWSATTPGAKPRPPTAPRPASARPAGGASDRDSEAAAAAAEEAARKSRICKGGGGGVEVKDPTIRKMRKWRPESAARRKPGPGESARRALGDALAARDVAYLERTVEQAVLLGDRVTLRAACQVLERHFECQRLVDQERAEKEERVRRWHEEKRRQRAEEARRQRQREAEEAERRKRAREELRRKELLIQERERAWQ